MTATNYLCFVEQEWLLKLEVELLGDGLDEILLGEPIEDDESVLGIALPLVDEQRSLRVGLVPLLVLESVQCHLQKQNKSSPWGISLFSRRSLGDLYLSGRCDDALDVGIDTLERGQIHSGFSCQVPSQFVRHLEGQAALLAVFQSIDNTFRAQLWPKVESQP